MALASSIYLNDRHARLAYPYRVNVGAYISLNDTSFYLWM
jgi:hypothetical protein